MTSTDELEGLGMADETIKHLKENGIRSKSDLKMLSTDEKILEKLSKGLSIGESLRLKAAVEEAGDKSEEPDWRDTVREKLYLMFQYEVTTVLTPVALFLNSDEAIPDWKALRLILEDDWAFRDYVRKLADDVRNGRRSLKKMDDKYSIGVAAIITYGFAGMARAWGKLPQVVQEQFLKLANQNWVLQKLSDGVNKIGGEKMFGLWNVIYGGYQTVKNVWKFKNGEIDGITCANNIAKVWMTTLGGWAGGVAGAALGTLVAGPVGALVGGAAGAMAGAYLMGLLVDGLTETLFHGSYDSALEEAWKLLGNPQPRTMETAKRGYEKLIHEILHKSLDRNSKARELLKADAAVALVEVSLKNDIAKEWSS